MSGNLSIVRGNESSRFPHAQMFQILSLGELKYFYRNFDVSLKTKSKNSELF